MLDMIPSSTHDHTHLYYVIEKINILDDSQHLTVKPNDNGLIDAPIHLHMISSGRRFKLLREEGKAIESAQEHHVDV